MVESITGVLQLPVRVICQPLVVNRVNVSAPLLNMEWIEFSSETRFLHSLRSCNPFLNIVSVVSIMGNRFNIYQKFIFRHSGTYTSVRGMICAISMANPF